MRLRQTSIFFAIFLIFVIFNVLCKEDILQILVKFECDRSRNSESAQKWMNGRPRVKFENFAKSEFRFGNNDKNKPRKQNFMRLRQILNFGNF